MLQRNKHRNPLPRGRAILLFGSNGRTRNKETKAVTNLFKTIRQWQRSNATAKMLNRLNDNMLADIGIARGDIRKAVHIFH